MEENLGNCNYCGAPNTRWRSGKVGCLAKCWLKNQPQGNESQKQYQPRPQYQPKPQPKPEIDWNRINEDKELAKEWVSAKICATDVLVAMIEKGNIASLEEFKGQFKGLVKFIYETGDETKNNEVGEIGI